jgi:hypothetical protein
MKLATLLLSVLFHTLFGNAFSADLLFLSGFEGDEKPLAESLGFSTEVVTPAQWSAMKTADFLQYKSIVIGDPFCSWVSPDVSGIFSSTQAQWAPAVLGNMVIIGE